MSKYHSNLYAALEREMEEKLDLDDADSSSYAVFGILYSARFVGGRVRAQRLWGR